MKIYSTKRGFTMTELLTVIAVIGLLAALLFPAIKNSIRHAEIRKAQLAITELQTAFKAYYTEYGKWPATSLTTGGGIMCTTNWMVALLRGENKTGQDLAMAGVQYNGNPRQIVFMEFKNEDLVIDAANNVTNLVDPWKGLYEFTFDITYSGVSQNPFEQSLLPPNQKVVHSDVLVWSKGPDGQESSLFSTTTPAGDGVGVNEDNVKSW
ncbi:MAG TPA: type II secretion system protein [Verrucomicrobiae bacterium]|nr:type II secretion system protein [Verrucomicrobiae bacterium]